LDAGLSNWDVTDSVTGHIQLNIMFMWMLELASLTVCHGCMHRLVTFCFL